MTKTKSARSSLSKKYPPPPPRKKANNNHQRAQTQSWVMDNLQMSITSDADHSDVEAYNHSLAQGNYPDTEHTSSHARNSTLGATRSFAPITQKLRLHSSSMLDTGTVSSSSHRRANTMSPKGSSSSSAFVMSAELSDAISEAVAAERRTPTRAIDTEPHRRRKVKPHKKRSSKSKRGSKRFSNKRLSKISATEEAPEQDSELPSLRSVNKHKAKAAKKRSEKNKVEQRKLIRRQSSERNRRTFFPSDDDSDSDQRNHHNTHDDSDDEAKDDRKRASSSSSSVESTISALESDGQSSSSTEDDSDSENDDGLERYRKVNRRGHERERSQGNYEGNRQAVRSRREQHNRHIKVSSEPFMKSFSFGDLERKKKKSVARVDPQQRKSARLATNDTKHFRLRSESIQKPKKQRSDGKLKPKQKRKRSESSQKKYTRKSEQKPVGGTLETPSWGPFGRSSPVRTKHKDRPKSGRRRKTKAQREEERMKKRKSTGNPYRSYKIGVVNADVEPKKTYWTRLRDSNRTIVRSRG